MDDHNKIPIIEEHSVQSTPFSTQGSTTPPQDGNVALFADLARQYIASNYLSYLPMAHSLPHTVDDLTKEFGIELYERMSNDPEIAGALTVLTMASTAHAPRITPKITSTDQAGYEDSKLLAEFIEHAIDRLEVPLQSVLRQLARNALTYGASVAEKVFEIAPYKDYGNFLFIKDIQPRKVRDTSFVVDGYNNLLGVLSLKQPNRHFPLGGMMPVNGLNNSNWQGDAWYNLNNPTSDPTAPQWGVIPISKVLVFTWQGQDNDPRGQSILRPAYTDWWVKQQIIQNMLQWFARFSQPSLWGTPPADAEMMCKRDEDGVPIPGTEVYPTELLRDTLTQFHSASVAAFPHGTEIHALHVGERADHFLSAIAESDRRILRAVLGQHLATGEGTHQTRAASQVHQNVLSIYVIYLKQWISEVLRKGFIHTLIEPNFGKEALQFAPSIDLGDGDGFPISPGEVSALQASGWFDNVSVEYLRAVDKLIGLPQR